MKTTFRIPMQDPYAYIELEGDEEAFEPAYEKYQTIMGIVKGEAGIGLPKKEFDEIYDEYRVSQKIANGADKYAEMNKEQQSQIQALKRSFARTKED